METWLAYGLLAAFLFGVSGLLTKVVGGKDHYAVNSHTLAMLVVIGAFVIFLVYYLAETKGQFPIPSNNMAVLLGLGVGATWAIGSVFVYRAFNLGANASQITPIFNLNTLVVVALAILILHELPDPQQSIKVVAGAILMVVGAFLVSY
ncbi:MAG: GRP family sugar transporter [Candidatus Micrarchaeota archaeon]